MVDYAFLIIQRDDLAALLTNPGALRYVHLSNPANKRTYPMSDAESDYAGFFRVLKQIKYRGGLSVHGGSNDIPNDAPRAIAFLRAREGSRTGEGCNAGTVKDVVSRPAAAGLRDRKAMRQRLVMQPHGQLPTQRSKRLAAIDAARGELEVADRVVNGRADVVLASLPSQFDGEQKIPDAFPQVHRPLEPGHQLPAL
jgi:hypothetical protein